MTTPVSGRLMSPELAFKNIMRDANATTSHAKGTISITEAQKALTTLEGHPHADGAERARIVQGFLDGGDGKALSPKAREVLSDFVKSQGQQGGGQKATELKLDAARGAKGANFQLDMARGHVAGLLQKGMVGKGELAKVSTALDAALKSVNEARKSLTGILKVADHSAKLADDELKAAGGDIQQAQKDIAQIVARAKSGVVTKAQLNEVQTWLSEPKTELKNAQAQLGAPEASTRKFPSDHEDGGFNGGGPGGGAMSMKYPSDNEDGATPGGGNVGGGGMMHTMKAPSDNEDGGPNIHPAKPGSPADVQKGPLKKERLAEMQKAFDAASKSGTVQWHSSMPIGQRFETAPLSRENHPDGFQHDVLVATGAMTPTAPQLDPNKAEGFWIKRTGGIAGMTQYAGPFTIAAAGAGGGAKGTLKSAVGDLWKDIQKVQGRMTEELRWEDAVRGVDVKGTSVSVSFDKQHSAIKSSGVASEIKSDLKGRGFDVDVSVKLV